MNNCSKYRKDSGSSSSWKDGNRHHDAWGSDNYSDSGRGSNFDLEAKREKAKKEAKRQRKFAYLEQESRCVFVDPQYEPSEETCRLFPVSKCVHCDGTHFGLPLQSDANYVREEGEVKPVPCPMQDHFEWTYGLAKM